MPRASVIARKDATIPSGGLCSKADAEAVGLTQRISAKVDRLFVKPYRALVDLLGISERNAFYRLSARRNYSSLELARLLRSEEGIEFLVVLMENARPRWWAAVLRMAAVEMIEQRHEADIELMRRVANADRLPDAATAAVVQDQDICSSLLAGLRGVPMVSGADRSMVSNSKR
jgi:hypothetical protein